MFPEVTFTQDIELDKRYGKAFLKYSTGAISFDNPVYGPNPGLEKINIDNTAHFDRYFDTAYAARQLQLAKAVKTFKFSWDEIAEEYFNLTRRIFHDYSFPEGKYIGYVSILNCNPRFLDSKTFQIFYKTETPRRTVGHELMHFIFYDYCFNTFPEVFSGLNPDTGTYWMLAELFNNVLLSFPEYRVILGSEGDQPYPQNEPYYTALVDLWNKSRDVNTFIPNAYSYLEKTVTI